MFIILRGLRRGRKVTPKMFARENGKESKADLLKKRLENGVRDLRERGMPGSGCGLVADKRTSCIEQCCY